ncbi:MAG: glycosyltransferase [Geminicoccaceae bacterium]
MKIIVVDPWMFTPPYDRELCNSLAASGHDVTFVGKTDGGAGDDQLGTSESGIGESISVLGLFSEPSAALPRGLSLFVKGLQHVRGMARLLREAYRRAPDVIHFQWLPIPLIDTVFVLLLQRIAPVVLTVHDSNPYNGAGPWLLRAGNMTALRRCNSFIVHNDLSKRRLVERGLPEERINKIAHGLLNQDEPTDRKVPDRTDNRVHFLQFGKLKAYKGADILLEALALLSPEHQRQCRVSIVGRPYLDTRPLIDLVGKGRLEDTVDLRFDFVSDEEMDSLFAAADFLIFPYRDIDTSGVLMAAIARAIPVVASDIGCFAEMLTDGEQGVLTKPNDPEALAAGLVALIEAPETRLAMRSHMEALRDHTPSWQAIAKKTIQVYQQARLRPTPKPVGVHP